MSRNIEDILSDDNDGSFTPTAPTGATPEQLMRALEPEPEREPEPVEAEPIPASPDDVEALRADGWDDADIEALTPDAAARHALRVTKRQKPERAVEPEVDTDLEALLTEELSGKTAKKLAPIIQKLVANQAALERGQREQVTGAARAKLVGTYPELARPQAMQAVLAVAGPNASPKAIEAATRSIFGVRQQTDERSEAVAQTNGQMTGGRRGPPTKRDPEAAKRAAWGEFSSSGNVDKALAVRRRLGG